MFRTVSDIVPRNVWRVLLAATAFALPAAHATAIEPGIAEAARKEGEVVWYTTLTVEQAVRPMIAAFEKKHPGIKVNFVRGDNSALVTRILNDSRANRPTADLVEGLVVQIALEKAGLIADWIPVEQAKDYPAAYKDPNNRWVASNLHFLAPVYNTQLVKKGEEPKSFEDLLDPRFKGKMIWNEGDGSNGALSFIANILMTKGREQGLAYLEKLAQQKIAVSEVSSRVLADWVITGEYTMALQIFNIHPSISAAKGAPIEWSRMSPLTGLVQTMSLMNNAPHPNAGKLLFDFVLSEEGQGVFQRAGYIPARPNVAARDPELKPGPGRFEANIITQQQKEALFPELKAIYDRLFK